MGNQGKVQSPDFSATTIGACPFLSDRFLRLNVIASVTVLSNQCLPVQGAIMWKLSMGISSPRISRTKNIAALPTCRLVLPRLLAISNGTSLLDPSCSGSGIVNRLDRLLESGTPTNVPQDIRGVSLITSRPCQQRPEVQKLHTQSALRS